MTSPGSPEMKTDGVFLTSFLQQGYEDSEVEDTESSSDEDEFEEVEKEAQDELPDLC